MKAMQVLVADLPHKMPNIEKDVPSASMEVLGVRATQMEAMKTLVGDLPTEDHQSDRKGKAVDIANWVGNKDDDWGEDELLANYDSDQDVSYSFYVICLMDFVRVSDCNFTYKTYVLETSVQYLICVMDYVVCVMDFVWLLNWDYILFRL